MGKAPSAEWLDKIAERIQRVRAVFKLTQSQMSEQTGIGRPRLNQWEKGLHPPDLEGAQKLRATYGISFDWLYYGDPRGMPGDLLNALNSAKLPAPAGRQPKPPHNAVNPRPFRARK